MINGIPALSEGGKIKILIIILLKIIEIAILVFIPYFVGKKLFDLDFKMANWGMGLVMILGTVLGMGVLLLLGVLLVESNLQLIKYLGF